LKPRNWTKGGGNGFTQKKKDLRPGLFWGKPEEEGREQSPRRKKGRIGKRRGAFFPGRCRKQKLPRKGSSKKGKNRSGESAKPRDKGMTIHARRFTGPAKKKRKKRGEPGGEKKAVSPGGSH